MESASRSEIATLVAGLGLMIPAGIGLLLSGAPTVFSPLPMLTVFAGFLSSNLFSGRAAICVLTLLFFAWHPRLFRGAPNVPIRSYVLFANVAVLSALYFAASWNWGLQYQGVHYTHVVFTVNIVWVAVLALGFARSLRGNQIGREHV